jgi:hypothetical protein
MTIVGINLIDRVGRRRLLLIGAAGMMICEYIVAIVGVTVGTVDAAGAASNVAAQKVLIAFVCIYIAFFAISWGPVGGERLFTHSPGLTLNAVAWVITGEIFVRVLWSFPA